MGKISVSILAKQLGVEPREAIARLKEIGVDAKTATSQVDEAVVNRLTAPKQRDNGTDEIRVASNIIRRRAKVAPITETVETVENTAPPAAEGKEPTATETVAQPELPSPIPATEPLQKEERQEISAPVPVAKPVPVSETPQKIGPNQARILGRMEIPGVTTRTSRVVTKENPIPPRPSVERPPADTPPRRTPPPAEPRKPSAGYEQRKPAPPTPSVPATELDRSRMKQVQLPPAAPSGDNRRGAKKELPGYGDGGKNSKKGAPAKKKEQPRKNEIIDKKERAFDPVYRGAKKKGKERAPETKKTEITIPKAIKRIIRISESISVGELAKRLGIKANDLIKSLMKMGMMVTINHALDHDTAVILASEYSYEVENVAVDLDEILESVPDAPETLEKRPLL